MKLTIVISAVDQVHQVKIKLSSVTVAVLRIINSVISRTYPRLLSTQAKSGSVLIVNLQLQ